MKDIIEFITYECRIEKIKSKTPDITDFTSRIKTSDYCGGRYNLRGTDSEIKKILPLTSLRFIHVWNSLDEVVVTYDKNEFKKVMDNKVNIQLLQFISDYKSKRLSARYKYYKTNTESIKLLMESLNCNYHFDYEEDVIKLIQYLTEEIDLPASSNKEEIRQKMKMEMDFIDLQREKRKSYNKTLI